MHDTLIIKHRLFSGYVSVVSNCTSKQYLALLSMFECRSQKIGDRVENDITTSLRSGELDAPLRVGKWCLEAIGYT